MVGATRGGRGGRRRGAGRKSTRKPPQADSSDASLTDLISNITSSLSAAHSFLRHHDLLLLPSQTLTLESHLSKSSRSLANLSSFLLSSAPPPPLATNAASNCWFHRFLLSSSEDDHDPRWPEFFRMSKPTFSLLFSALSPALQSSLPPTIPPNSALPAAIYRLAHSASYAAIARLFGLSSPADACRAFYTVCKVICDQLGELFELRSDLERIVLGFGWISLPNCFGVLGASKFPVSGELLGSNGFLMVQALVDSEGRFLDVSAGWPSTMKPGTALAQTKLFNGVEESKELLNGPDFKLNDGNVVPQYVIGDSCYPLLPWLLTPYAEAADDNGLSFDRLVFNEVHRRAMGMFRKAFARVRCLWRLLDRQWKEECVEFLPFVIVTCCLLYNFLIKHGEPLPDVEEEEAAVSAYDGEDESGNEDAKRVRDAIALHLSRVSQRR